MMMMMMMMMMISKKSATNAQQLMLKCEKTQKFRDYSYLVVCRCVYAFCYALPTAETCVKARLKTSSHLTVSVDNRRHWSFETLSHVMGRQGLLVTSTFVRLKLSQMTERLSWRI